MNSPELSSIETLPQLLETHARARPNAPALLAPGREPASYAELWGFIEREQARLQARVPRGARIAVVANNGPEMAAACLLAGCHGVAVPLSPSLTEHEATRCLRELGIAAALLNPAAAPGLAAGVEQLGLACGVVSPSPEAPAGTSPLVYRFARLAATHDDDTARALLLCTAGTSGGAKTVPFEHAHLLAWAQSVSEHLQLDASSRCLNVMPFFHSHGLLVALLGSLWAGGSVVCTAGLYLPQEWSQWVQRLSPTWFTAVPSVLEVVLQRLRRHGAPAHRLRLIRTGSAPIRPEVRSGLQDLLDVPVVDTYGMTEVVGWLACAPLERAGAKLGAVGRATRGLTVLNAEGRELAPGEHGELAMARARCLWPLEAAPSAEPFRRCGDLGFIDRDGFVFLTGRASDAIQRSGEKIAPQEVDRVFYAHPDVAEVVAFGLRSERHGEEVGLAVVPRAGCTLDQASLQALAVERLSPAMIPRRIFIVSQLPKTEAGKISRRRIAEWLDPQERA